MALAMAASSPLRADGAFTPLGDLSGGGFSSSANGISADGSVVVGVSTSTNGAEAFRWTAVGGMAGLGDLPGGSFWSFANGVSADGSVVVGRSVGANGYEAFRWTETGGMVGLGDLPGGVFSSEANAVNADGSVVVGVGYTINGNEAFRWTESGGMVSLGDLSGGVIRSAAYGVNADGSVVVGVGTSANGNEAFRWTEAGGMAGLGDLPGGSFWSKAYDVNSDGSVVVGKSAGANGYEAFRWTEAGGMVGLGDLPGGAFSSEANAVNADGTVVVGQGTSANGLAAFRWTAADGMQTVTDWLVANGVTVAAGYTLDEALGVNADGSVVVGVGTGSNGTEAWIARVNASAPTPNGNSSNGSGVLVLNSNLSDSLVGTARPVGKITGLTNLMLNGAHHRPLMDSAMPAGNHCAWINGDFANFNSKRKADGGLAEVGYCGRARPGELMFGIGLGKSRLDEDTVFSGNSEVRGQYLLAEIDYRPGGGGPLFSFTGLAGSWDAYIKRGYLNAGFQDSSRGRTDVTGLALRARIDWLDAWQWNGISFTPRLQASLTRTEMDGYTETGGGFPARFDSRQHTAREMRAGVRADKALGERTVFHADLEGVHRFDDNGPGTSGQIIGLFAFNQPGTKVESQWLRLGLEVDHELNKSWQLSASLHAATVGEDPDLSAAVSLKTGW